GWNKPGPTLATVDYVESGNYKKLHLPVIRRAGRADGGHAVALVGYTSDGFIVQNSWGPDWGAGGFALLPYEDYLLHATDVWVAQLGVPVKMTAWAEGGAADSTAGLHRAARAIPLADIRPYVVDIGNNGELSGSGSYWTTETDLDRLFNEIIPERTTTWTRRRVMLYLHGGLNDEQAVAQRIVAFRDVFLENEIYPVHIMWESGVSESLSGLIQDLFTDVDDRAGAVGDWLRGLRDGLIEAKDRSLELTAALPGGALWGEMKENARLASTHPDRKGGMQLVVQHARKALGGLEEAERKKWELHIVGHSAGSIFVAHALRHLMALGVTLKSLQFMAPAITMKEFKDLVLPHVKAGACPVPTVYILSDSGELDDEVGPYGKSLLYLVSNAFEERRATPILGMEKFIVGAEADPETAKLYGRQSAGHPTLVVAGKGKDPAGQSQSDSHGGFDNDPVTMNSIMYQMLGGPPKREFQLRDLQFEAVKPGGARRGGQAASAGWGAYPRRR
ncbi:MAG TPA: C1 family peptidase, partial [Candidatus Limnocylindrales bacterium]|nr:C1 family peptidase [Candidatus Limnocylindrales bacterium]